MNGQGQHFAENGGELKGAAKLASNIIKQLEDICPLLAGLNRMGCRGDKCRWWIADEEVAEHGECALALLALAAAKASGAKSTRPANVVEDRKRPPKEAGWRALKYNLEQSPSPDLSTPEDDPADAEPSERPSE